MRAINPTHDIAADRSGGKPSIGNIAGSLSAIEEKSLDCISKCGTARFKI
ncbi:hypothetical protein [Paenibacillus pectinilyticus]